MSLTIVMYHYVRDLKRSRFPGIKGLELEAFRRQINYLRKNFEIVTASDVIGAALGRSSLPETAALLTFDDGYVDHYTSVSPILNEHAVQGCFFPPGKCVLENRVLDVNKIHFVLATVHDTALIVTAIRNAIEDHANEHELNSFDAYWSEFAIATRFDSADVIFVKRMLQAALPKSLRSLITDEFFRRFVSADEANFARELYMSADQLRLMVREGMYVGSHGYDHYWMNHLPPEEQEREVSQSLDFLRQIGAPTSSWIMCYPYGESDESLERILTRHNCAIGLTTRVGVAEIGTDHPLRLPRLDTNDLPKA